MVAAGGGQSKEVSNTVLWSCVGNRSLGFIFVSVSTQALLGVGT